MVARDIETKNFTQDAPTPNINKRGILHKIRRQQRTKTHSSTHPSLARLETPSHTLSLRLQLLAHSSFPSIKLLGRISDLIRSLRNLNLLLGSLSRSAALVAQNLLSDFECSIRTARLSSKDFARLVDDEDAARGTLSTFQANGRDECSRRVAEERVGQVLLGLEGRVGLWAVV